jgi:hypothetical protein
MMLYFLLLIAYCTIMLPLTTVHSATAAELEDMACRAVNKTLRARYMSEPAPDSTQQVENDLAWEAVDHVINNFRTPSILRRSSQAQQIKLMINNCAATALKNIATPHQAAVKPYIIRLLLADLSACIWCTMRWPGIKISQDQIIKVITELYASAQRLPVPISTSLPTPILDTEFRVPPPRERYGTKQAQ